MRIVTWMAAAVLAVMGTLSAQVPPAPVTPARQMPPEIAEQLRQIGPVVDPAATARIYGPVHPRAPYVGVTVARDLSYGTDPRQVMDVFMPGQNPKSTVVNPLLPGFAPAPVPAGPPRPVLIFVSGGAGNKIEPVAGGAAFYDNIMLWAVKNGMTGLNVQRLATPGRSATDAAKDIGRVVDWVQKNIARYGGNPGRVFVWAHSAGNAAVARYLADPETHLTKGHGVKGAILMGATAAIVPPAVSANLAQSGVPIFVAAGELDIPAAVTFVDAMRKTPCEGRVCARTAIFNNHSHMSAVFAPNTADDSVTAPLLEWMAAVP
jgi:acetyl esterase/lipase